MRARFAPLFAVLLLTAGPSLALADSPAPEGSFWLRLDSGVASVAPGETARVVAIVDGPAYATYAFVLRGADGLALASHERPTTADASGHAEVALAVRTPHAPAHPVVRATLVATNEAGASAEAPLVIVVLPPPAPAPPAFPAPPPMPEIVLRPAPPAPVFERPALRFFRLFSFVRPHEVPLAPVTLFSPPPPPPMPPMIMTEAHAPWSFRPIELRPATVEWTTMTEAGCGSGAATAQTHASGP